MKKIPRVRKHHIVVPLKISFWFSTGVFLGLFFFVSFVFIFFEKKYANVVYPGVTINGINLGGKTKEQVKAYFAQKNAIIAQGQIGIKLDSDITTISAKQLELGYNENLLAQQAYGIGRTNNLFSDIYWVMYSYMNGLKLNTSYSYNSRVLDSILDTLSQKVRVDPVDAVFSFENGRVTAFRPSLEGQDIDRKIVTQQFERQKILLITGQQQYIELTVPIKTIQPKVTTDQANNLGIKELIGTGTSLFQGSIPNRIHNVSLAASRINSVLVAPNEEFSFNKVLGDISKFTGYKEAYVIENGKTVLGDGGGVCQVSTTLFRAILNAGLPVVERHSHAYRVHYYEEDTGPGMDATVYAPSVDFRFKNDTGHYILIQSFTDLDQLRLTFNLYGTKDGRQVAVSQPIIKSQTPAPPDLYQDDPNLPKGVVKQVDFSASGAKTVFTRTVKKDGKVIIDETFVSNYRPWQAIFLRGTRG